MRPIILLAGLAAALACSCGVAQAQKSGGVLKIYHRDNPPSASIHEEATNSVVVPFMSVFNNLVLYDQGKPQNSPSNIVPDLAKSWRWSADGKALTFTLQDGVKWHAGQPFTAKDVVCTFDLLTGRAEPKLRRNPRTSWYGNVDTVTANGELEVTVNLKRPQPSLLALLGTLAATLLRSGWGSLPALPPLAAGLLAVLALACGLLAFLPRCVAALPVTLRLLS